MKRGLILALALSFAPSCFAQLTQEQKVQDFKALAAQYDRNYSNYLWKLKVFGFDALDLQPWLNQIWASNDDLSFYDIEARYVAALHDSHDEATIYSSYEAYLPLTADIFDGDVLIDGIDTSTLDPASFPIQVGDQLLSVDGVSMHEWMKQLAPYAVNGRANPLSTSRLATAMTLDRLQSWYPYASNIKPGAIASLRIRSQSTDKVTTYNIPWNVIGTPVTQEGRSPNLSRNHHAGRFSIKDQMKLNHNVWHIRNATGWTPPKNSAQRAVSAQSDGRRHVQAGHLKPGHPTAGSIEPFDSPFPLFNPPAGFKLRLGADPGDNFVSGSFPVGGKTIGFIRVPTFEPADETTALQQFQDEVAWFQKNTKGLIIDVMGNGGGDGCYAVSLVSLLATKPFWALNSEPRPSEQWIDAFSSEVEAFQFGGAPQQDIDILQSYVDTLESALAHGDRNTKSALPLCTLTQYAGPATDDAGNSIAYTKPIVLLTDNFTLSSAEIFGSELQDSGRATVYGMRSDGGGGDVVSYDNSGAHSETNIRVTESLIIRSRNVSTPGYPTAPYIENIGVYPDIIADYQTQANLFSGGQPFVAGFVAAIDKLTQ